MKQFMNIKRVLRERSISDLLNWGIQRIAGTVTGKRRLLPDFIVIGAQRAGTTSFFNYLCQHPEVHPSFPKEVHYFSNNFQKGLSWYRSHFPLASSKVKSEEVDGRKFITGEATPYYLCHPHAPLRAFQVVPKALLIVLLRDPVERAYSHYHHEVRMGAETLSFEDALDKEDERLQHETQKMVENEQYRSFNHQHFSYLSRGIYLEQIQAWRKHFSPESMLILTSEGFYSEPSKAINQVTDQLGLSGWQLKDTKKYNSSPYPEMDARTRKRLVEYYQPYNEKLFEYLNMDLGWEH
jgi:hypothetical protein